MNSVKAIQQLEDLKRDRLSFIHNNELDEVFLNDIKAISLATKALMKCPDVKDTSYYKSIRRSKSKQNERKSRGGEIRKWTNKELNY